jgi:hypothetical protein
MSVLPCNSLVDMSRVCTYDGEEGPPIFKIKLFELRSHFDDLITYIDSSSDPEVQPYYSYFRALGEIIIRKDQTSETVEVDGFFKPISRPESVTST